jgi:hypothetical protein
MSNPLIIDITNDVFNECAVIDIPENSIINGSYDYYFQASDGIDFQALSGSIRYSVTNKSGIITPSIFVEIPAQTETSGTLTYAWKIVPGINDFSIQIKFSSSLTPTIMQLKMYDHTKELS